MTPRHRLDTIENDQIKQLLRCPGCESSVRVADDKQGKRTARVKHEMSCPRVPLENRLRGELTYVIVDPQLLPISTLEGDHGANQAP